MIDREICAHGSLTSKRCQWCEEDMWSAHKQRRYEIARDVLASLWPTANLSVDVIAQEAVQAADALLAALEESSDGE